MYKLGFFKNDGTEVPFRYHDIWAIEHTKGPDRIVIAPSKDHIDRLLELSSSWKGPRKILYILLTSRCDNKLGRYESPSLTETQLSDFLNRYRDFLESDARHHLWIGLYRSNALLVYDQHNVIYGYGDLDEYQKVLKKKGFSEGTVTFPSPHTHPYHQANDSHEVKILTEWEWKWSPLDENDEY
jgi:hypothetical protein